MKNLSDIKKACKNKHVYIYGAGTYALHMCEYLRNESLEIDGFIVSSEKNIEERRLLGIPVYSLNEIEYSPNTCVVILALSEKYHQNVQDLMHINGFVNWIPFSDKELKMIKQKVDVLSREILQKYTIKNVIKREHRENILIVRMDGIGDMVLTTPFIRELRRNHPCAHITLVTSLASLELFVACPYLDEVLSYDFRRTLKFPLKRRLEDIGRFVQENLQFGQYDLALVPRWDMDWNGASFLAFLSGATRRIAYSEKVNSDKADYNHNYDLMFTDLIDNRSLMHEVERNLCLLESLKLCVRSDSLELWCTKEDYSKVGHVLRKFDMDYEREIRKIIAIGLAASDKHRKWNDKYYIKLLNLLGKEHKEIMIVLLGSYTEKDSAIEIEQCVNNVKILNLVNEFTLRENFALLTCCCMYIGHDTGLMHIATAAGAYVVEISSFPLNGEYTHSNSIYRFGPWNEWHSIIRPAIGKYYPDMGWINENGDLCINDISVEEVYLAIQTILKK